MYTVEAIDSFERFRALAAAWNGLLAQSDVDNPFLRHEWVECWWNSYGGGKELLVLLVKEGEDIVAIAPLMRCRSRWRKLPVRIVTFIANEHSLRLGVIMKNDDPAILRQIMVHLQERCRYDLILLDLVENDSATEKGITALASYDGRRYLPMESFRSPYIPSAGCWEEYLKGRSKNFRHKISRIANLCRRRGDCTVTNYSGSGVEQALDAVLCISKKTWKFRSKTAIASNGRDTKFYRLLAETASAKGWLNLWILRAGGAPAAFAYNLDYGGKIYALKIGFDETFSALAPSEYLNACAIRACFEEGRREYDWLGKDLPFKMRWTSACRLHRKHLLFSGRLYGRALFFLETGIVPLLKKLFVRVPRPAASAGTGSSVPGSTL
jgi:CelD/BcsL family acetyltransferase involved in cellulose biosynthesis